MITVPSFIFVTSATSFITCVPDKFFSLSLIKCATSFVTCACHMTSVLFVTSASLVLFVTSEHVSRLTALRSSNLLLLLHTIASSASALKKCTQLYYTCAHSTCKWPGTEAHCIWHHPQKLHSGCVTTPDQCTHFTSPCTQCISY